MKKSVLNIIVLGCLIGHFAECSNRSKNTDCRSHYSKESSSAHEPGYDKTWKPNFILQNGVITSFLAMIPNFFRKSGDNPLNNVIDAATDKPVVFGQNVEQYSFRMKGFDQSGMNQYRQILSKKGNVVLDVIFYPNELPFHNLKPTCIEFSNIDETVSSAPNNKNIATKAASFVADKIAQHEKETGYGPYARLEQRSVAIPTKYGIYHCAKSGLYDDDAVPHKEIRCISQEKFDDWFK